MTFRKLMMFAGIGGFVYWHRKNGGEWSLDSFKQTGRDLIDRARGRIDTVAQQAQSKIHDVAGKVVESTDVGTQDTAFESGATNTGFESDAGFRTRDDVGYRR